MKVVAFNGSPRRDGNTAFLIQRVFDALNTSGGFETEVVQLGGQPIRGCIACFRCFANQDRRCAVEGDIANDCIAKMAEADGVILGSPTYFASVSAEMKALIDRAGLVTKANGGMLRRKVGAAVAAVRRAGAINALDTMNHFLLSVEMVVPGSSYWNLAVGREKGEVERDQEGMATMKTLGENMAWLLQRLHG